MYRHTVHTVNTLTSYFNGKPVPLVKHRIIPSANHVAVAHCKKSREYSSRASVHFYIKHQNWKKCDCGMVFGARLHLISWDFTYTVSRVYTEWCKNPKPSSEQQICEQKHLDGEKDWALLTGRLW